MKKFPILKCPICGKPYQEVGTFGNHMRNEHPGTIPEGWSDLRYAYYVHTGKSHGKCRECGGDTPWNETTGAYAKICTSDACRKKFRDRFMAGMRARYGQANLLDDPNFRQRMLTGRKISGEMEFFDGGKVAYMGNLEKGFISMLNTFFRFPSSDIISPSPNRYTYYYKNPNDQEHEGMHFYIPDFYIPSCNLEIELKSSNNQRPRNLMIDVPKDACKDIMMIRNPMVNYVKVYEDDYYVFFQVFADLARQNQTSEKRPIKYISRALLTSLYREYIPDDCLKILDQYIYKYSEKSILRKRPPKNASESELPILEENKEVTEVLDEEENHETSPSLVETLYRDENVSEDDSENEDSQEPESVGVNPLMYYEMGQYASSADVIKDNIPAENQHVLECFNETFFTEDWTGALEGDKDHVIDTGTVAGRAAVKYGKWRDKLFGKSIIGKLASKAFVNVKTENSRIVVKGINANLLLYRIKEHYSESRLRYIFEYKYNEKSWKLYQKKKIGRGDMKIDYVYAPEFFCLELVELFNELGDAYHDRSYKLIAQLIYENSWLSKADNTQVPPLDLEPLTNLSLELLPHQKKFIELWPILKNQLHLNGYVLAFTPGKGKTLTSVGLAECLKVDKVFIVCPNNLKDNWALEIKKYYSKYSDEKLWMRDVCILGTNYGNPQTAKFIITNNENIKLMMNAIKGAVPNSLFVLDESHNFRNYNGERSKELFALIDKMKPENVLPVSATPIKAVPAELTPILRIIDPTFNDEAAEMYAKCFKLNDTMAMNIVNKRFGKVIYRPKDVNVELPPLYDEVLPLKAPHEERYYLENVRNEVVELFKKNQSEWLESVKGPRKDFEDSIRKYSTASHKTTAQYLDWVFQSANSLHSKDGTDYHELSVEEFMHFIDTFIRQNPSTPMGEADRLQQMQNQFVTAAKSNMGKAVGKIYPKRRAEMFIAIYDANKQYFYDAIRNRTKKTVIFSTMVPVVKHIAEDLNSFGIGTVTITGDNKNRLETLTKFREDPNTLVLVATSWCMGVGVTLTEASQMFFFGAPWRSTDYEQASMRIHRIGQTDPVNIYNVGLDSKIFNLSDRMQKILDWSSKMFGAAITDNDVDDIPTEVQPAQEFYGMGMIYDVVFDINNKLNSYSYGMRIGDKIVDPEDKTLYDRNYRTMSPGLFDKLKGGICYDYVAFQDFFLKSHGCHGEIYFIEIIEPYMTHTFSIVEDGDDIIYFESAFLKLQGVYRAKTIDEICSFIINAMIDGMDIKKPRFNVYHIKVNYGWYNESMNSYLHKVHERGTKIKIKYDPNLHEIEKVKYYGEANESWGPFNDRLDSRQYALATSEEMELLNIISSMGETIIETRSNFVERSLKHEMSGPLCETYPGRDEISNAMNIFAINHYMLKKLYHNRIEAYPFILKVESDLFVNHEHPVLLPMIAIPFSGGAIWPVYGYSYLRNGLYFGTDIHTFMGEAARWIGNSYGKGGGSLRATNTTLTLYPVESDLFLTKFKSMDYSDLLEYLKDKKGIVRDIEDCIAQKDAMKVEVFHYGWSVTRF